MQFLSELPELVAFLGSSAVATAMLAPLIMSGTVSTSSPETEAPEQQKQPKIKTVSTAAPTETVASVIDGPANEQPLQPVNPQEAVKAPKTRIRAKNLSPQLKAIEQKMVVVEKLMKRVVNLQNLQIAVEKDLANRKRDLYERTFTEYLLELKDTSTGEESGINKKLVQDYAAELFLKGTHQKIKFDYEREQEKINAYVEGTETAPASPPPPPPPPPADSPNRRNPPTDDIKNNAKPTGSKPTPKISAPKSPAGMLSGVSAPIPRTVTPKPTTQQNIFQKIYNPFQSNTTQQPNTSVRPKNVVVETPDGRGGFKPVGSVDSDGNFRKNKFWDSFNLESSRELTKNASMLNKTLRIGGKVFTVFQVLDIATKLRNNQTRDAARQTLQTIFGAAAGSATTTALIGGGAAATTTGVGAPVGVPAMAGATAAGFGVGTAVSELVGSAFDIFFPPPKTTPKPKASGGIVDTELHNSDSTNYFRNLSRMVPYASGGAADFWTLAAVTAAEDAINPQGRADVAQSVYNRVRSGMYDGGTSIKKNILSPGQYSVTFSNPKDWKNITDKKSANLALRRSGKPHVSAEVAAKNITNPLLMKNAKKFVGGRPDFLGEQFKPNMNPKLGDITRGKTHNFFGWMNNYKGKVPGEAPTFKNVKYASGGIVNSNRSSKLETAQESFIQTSSSSNKTPEVIPLDPKYIQLPKPQRTKEISPLKLSPPGVNIPNADVPLINRRTTGARFSVR